MNKTDLIEIAAEKNDLSKAAASRTLDSILEAIVTAVASGDSVTLIGFGTFKPKKRPGRTGRNPQTGKEIKIAAATLPQFKPGATFKSTVNGKKTASKK